MRSSRQAPFWRYPIQSLGDIQSGVRNAVVKGDFAPITALLLGGRRPEYRLAIHRRHYQTSLIKALLDKFPATIWLVGSRLVSEAARVFVANHPPGAPCIAEYGGDFPAFLATCRGADLVPYLQAFAELEWHIGHVAIAVDGQPLTIQKFSTVSAEVVSDTTLTLHTGVRYLETCWPLDELIKIYLAETRPDRLEFEPADVWLEIVGTRGEFRIERLAQPDFIFRKSLFEGRTIGDAAEKALEANSTFDAGRALVAFIANGLVAGMRSPKEEQMNSVGQATAHTWEPLLWYVSAREWLARFPFWILQLGLRVGVGLVFFNAGLLKFKSFEFAVKLFQDEYKVPLLDPATAARMTTIVELVFPVLLFVGLASRLATLPLLGEISVIQIFVYKQAWTDHVFWVSALLLILTRGPGVFSLDYLIERYFAKRR